MHRRSNGAGRLLALTAGLLSVGVCLALAAPPDSAPKKGMQVAISYAPVPFSELKGWEQDDHLAALRAFMLSCDRIIAAVKGGGMSTKPPRPELLSACEEGRAITGKSARALAKAFFERNFEPHRVDHKGPEGMVTGYYEPVIEGSRTRGGRFQTPVYRRPADLVDLVDETQQAKSGAITHGRKTAAGFVPFPSRAEIDKGALAGKGLEILWLTDPVELFFLQIQGSGRVRLTDGTTIRINYDGKNGHPYTSIGRVMIDGGMMPADRASLGGMAKWLRADPERGKKVMWQNASYVFFRELKGEEAKQGPQGVLHIPLTPGRSLAVDTSHHAIGLPVYVSSPTLADVLRFGDGFRRLMIAQDTGAAIRGPERGDIYFGSGEAAGRLAGVTRHPARFFVLLPRVERPKAGEAATRSPKSAKP